MGYGSSWAMSEPLDKPVRRRRPTLTAALKAAKAAGLPVKSAVVEDGRVMLTFVGDDTPIEAGGNEWDEALGRGKH
jgi:hypothetical protein